MKYSACVLITNPTTGLILGVSRRNDFTAFGLPGGKQERTDRSLADTACRELFEETGMEITPEALTSVFSRQGSDGWFCEVFQAPFERVTGTLIHHPGEGKPAWITWEVLCAGPFGEFNVALQTHLGGLPTPRGV